MGVRVSERERDSVYMCKKETERENHTCTHKEREPTKRERVYIREKQI